MNGIVLHVYSYNGWLIVGHLHTDVRGPCIVHYVTQWGPATDPSFQRPHNVPANTTPIAFKSILESWPTIPLQTITFYHQITVIDNQCYAATACAIHAVCCTNKVTRLCCWTIS